jgi:transposase-like protein
MRHYSVAIGRGVSVVGEPKETLVFGIYQRNGKVITFPISDRKHDTLIPLIKPHTKKVLCIYR